MATKAAKLNNEQLIEHIEGMTVLDLSNLVKDLEEKFGVSAQAMAAPVAMGGALNEDIDGQASPVDLSNELRQLGVRVCADVTDILELL